MIVLEHDGYVHPGARFSQSGAMLGHGQGMTLRDYFAGQALAGICNAFSGANEDAEWFEQVAAKAVYRIADAMLAAREVQS